MSVVASLFTTNCDWPITALLPIFGIGIVFLGLSAAMFGGWLEREGPRKAAFVAALCWSGGFFLSAFGVYIHQLWLLWMGLGVVGGIGLGLGYISPVSTLIKWFPDRRGMATGMAIMGFGGGAMIGSPLANLLIAHFKSSSSSGVWETDDGVGGHLSCVDDGRRVRLSRPASRLEAADLDADDATEGNDRRGTRRTPKCAQDAAVLARMGRALLQRHSRYRRLGDGVANAAGNLRWHAHRSTRGGLRCARSGR